MAASAVSSRRIDVLSRPKPVPPGFLEDRRSVYWVDRLPPCPGPNGTTTPALTARQEELCRAKNPHPGWRGDKLTPIWTVSQAAQSATTSDRLVVLAESRPVHNSYKHERSVCTLVTQGARTAVATSRLEQLAEPKPHKVWANSEDTLRQGEFASPITAVHMSALKARCTGRVEQLAEAKGEHDSYLGERPVRWPVSDTAKNAIATVRLQQMARPKSGRLHNDDYDPYKVTAAARLTRPSPRVCELSVPIPRKVRTKRN